MGHECWMGNEIDADKLFGIQIGMPMTNEARRDVDMTRIIDNKFNGWRGTGQAIDTASNSSGQGEGNVARSEDRGELKDRRSRINQLHQVLTVSFLPGLVTLRPILAIVQCDKPQWGEWFAPAEIIDHIVVITFQIELAGGGELAHDADLHALRFGVRVGGLGAHAIGSFHASLEPVYHMERPRASGRNGMQACIVGWGRISGIAHMRAREAPLPWKSQQRAGCGRMRE